ncbi:MAG: fumarate reductase subunit FrdC [Arsenophonus sp. NC-WZS1-MAG3]
MMTKRKPYVRKMLPNWWQQIEFYRFYVIREATAIPQIWFSLVVLYGVCSLTAGGESWSNYISFLDNPIVLLINIFTLIATLFHTKTWFELTPKAINIIIKNKKIAQETIVKLLWGITFLVTIIILAVSLR